MATAISGRRGRFQINGTNFYVEQWQVAVQTDIIDATSFEDQNAVTGRTARVLIDGVDQATVQVKGYIDADMMGASNGLTIGADLTSMKLFVNKAIGARCWNFPNAKVARINEQGMVRGRFEFNITVESNGAFTPPT